MLFMWWRKSRLTLLQRRSGKVSYGKGRLATPGGHIEQADCWESPDAFSPTIGAVCSAHREVLEEVGVDLKGVLLGELEQLPIAEDSSFLLLMFGVMMGANCLTYALIHNDFYSEAKSQQRQKSKKIRFKINITLKIMFSCNVFKLIYVDMCACLIVSVPPLMFY